MNKWNVKSILLANNYLLKCKVDQSCCEKTELARKYLIVSIKKTLNQRKNSLISVFSFLVFF